MGKMHKGETVHKGRKRIKGERVYERGKACIKGKTQRGKMHKYKKVHKGNKKIIKGKNI